MIEKTKNITFTLDGEEYFAQIHVLSAIEADEALTSKLENIDLAKKYCLRVETAADSYTVDEFLALPGSFPGFKEIVNGIAKWGWLGGESKND
jgi:hypothetical protein